MIVSHIPGRAGFSVVQSPESSRTMFGRGLILTLIAVLVNLASPLRLESLLFLTNGSRGFLLALNLAGWDPTVVIVTYTCACISYLIPGRAAGVIKLNGVN